VKDRLKRLLILEICLHGLYSLTLFLCLI